MTTAYTITDNELLKLKEYLKNNACFLAMEERIRLESYHKGDENSRKWTIIDIPVLGEIRIYISDFATILKIDGTEVLPKERCRNINFFSVESQLRLALKNKTKYKNQLWSQISK